MQKDAEQQFEELLFSLVRAEAQCSYHVTLRGSELLWECGGRQHLDKRGEKTRIKEEEEAEEEEGGEDSRNKWDYTKKCPPKTKDTSHIHPPWQNSACMCDRNTIDTLAKVPPSLQHWWHVEGLMLLWQTAANKHRFVSFCSSIFIFLFLLSTIFLTTCNSQNLCSLCQHFVFGYKLVYFMTGSAVSMMMTKIIEICDYWGKR